MLSEWVGVSCFGVSNMILIKDTSGYVPGI